MIETLIALALAGMAGRFAWNIGRAYYETMEGLAQFLQEVTQ